LKLADIPSPDVDWHAINEFALTFDGYETWGSQVMLTRYAMLVFELVENSRAGRTFPFLASSRP